MSDELKPCPFCGSTNVGLAEIVSVQCFDCGAIGPEADATLDDRDGSALWNNRRSTFIDEPQP